MTRDQWSLKEEAIRKSRKGCECSGRSRCTSKWIRCNGVLREQSKAREKLGPTPSG